MLKDGGILMYHPYTTFPIKKLITPGPIMSVEMDQDENYLLVGSIYGKICLYTLLEHFKSVKKQKMIIDEKIHCVFFILNTRSIILDTLVELLS